MNFPFLLAPAAKSYLWGGSRLNDDFGKNIDLCPLAETWECSTHPCGQSTVASGEFQGMPLGDVLNMHPEFLGSHPLEITHGRPELPILIKLKNISDFGSGTQNITIISLLILTCRHNHASTRRNEI